MIHRHHRKLRSQGGDDSPVNVIGVPDSLHQWIHENPAKAHDLGLIVHSYQDPAEVMVTIPEELIKTKREPKPRAPEKPRNRAVVSVRVPKDEREDGAGVLDDIYDRGRELLCEPLGWSETVPLYDVIVALCNKGIEAIEIEFAQEAAGGGEG